MIELGFCRLLPTAGEALVVASRPNPASRTENLAIPVRP
jgi:hypothetical protein